MFRRLRTLLFALLFAAMGAVAGRVVSDIRRQQAAGEEPRLNLDGINLRARDIAPGVVAAMRVSSRPWSLLHIPPWMAAFSVNFAIGAFARELGPLGRMAQGEFGEGEGEPDPGAGRSAEPAAAWTATTSEPAAPTEPTDAGRSEDSAPEVERGERSTSGDEPARPDAPAGEGFTAFPQDSPAARPSG